MMVEHWTKSRNELLGDNADMELISSDNMTVCKFNIKNPVELGCHVHEHEKITIVSGGEMIIEYNGIAKEMRAGDVCIIPGNVPHKASITKAPFQSFDIFTPARKDFIGNMVSNEGKS